jgi:hypothetical protein
MRMGNEGIMTEWGKVLEAKPVPVPFAINSDGSKLYRMYLQTATLAYLLGTNH